MSRMFSIHNVSNSNPLLDYFYLSNDKVSCKIYPNLGASLQQFSIGQTKIIQGIEPLESDLPYFRRYYPASFLFPFPGRIAGGSSLILTRRGGLPPNPNEALIHENGLVEWSNFQQSSTNSEQLSETREKNRNIQQAQVWLITTDGKIILTAEVPQVILQNSNFVPPNCIVSE